jgi:CheY-like chemotaxis protein
METKKILVVDDDIDVINIIETILTNEGYKVITANNKIEGLKKIKSENPDLAVLDVMMTTHFEGFELAQEIITVNKNLPILIQTSIEVLQTSEQDVVKMAHEYRKSMSSRDLDVLLVENKDNGKAGVDYLTEDGKSVFVPVSGFIKKPVDSKKLLPALKKLLS